MQDRAFFLGRIVLDVTSIQLCRQHQCQLELLRLPFETLAVIEQPSVDGKHCFPSQSSENFKLLIRHSNSSCFYLQKRLFAGRSRIELVNCSSSQDGSS